MSTPTSHGIPCFPFFFNSCKQRETEVDSLVEGVHPAIRIYSLLGTCCACTHWTDTHFVFPPPPASSIPQHPLLFFHSPPKPCRLVGSSRLFFNGFCVIIIIIAPIAPSTYLILISFLTGSLLLQASHPSLGGHCAAQSFISPNPNPSQPVLFWWTRLAALLQPGSF